MLVASATLRRGYHSRINIHKGRTVFREAGPSDNLEMKDEEMSAPREKDQPDEKMAMEAGPSSANPSMPMRQGSLKRKEPHGGFEEDDTVRVPMCCDLLLVEL